MNVVSVILAAGKGTRMRSERPKVLHELLGAPILEHVLRASGAVDPARQVVVVGHGRELVEEAFADRGITFVHQERQLGTGHAAKCAVDAVGDDLPDDAGVLILNGDLPLLGSATLARLVERFESGADVALLTCTKSDPAGYGRIVRNDSSSALAAIVEEKDADESTRGIPEVNVGTYLFRADVFRAAIAKIGTDNAQGELYLTDAVVRAADDGRRVDLVAVEDETETAQVNCRRELAEATDILRGRIVGALMDDGVTVCDPRSTYVEIDVEVAPDTVIYPFCVLRRGVRIGAQCEIGPFCHLRPNTVIENRVRIGNFVETKKSTIGAGAKVPHLTYVGDATIGEKANIGAGTIFANYDGVAKHPSTVGANAFIGSGSIIVAPVSIGDRAMTAAGAVVLKGRDVEDDEVVAGVPAKSLRKPSSPKK